MCGCCNGSIFLRFFGFSGFLVSCRTLRHSVASRKVVYAAKYNECDGNERLGIREKNLEKGAIE